MITKLTVSGYSPTLLTRASGRKFLNIHNYGGADLFMAIDGTTGVTDSTGLYPGIILHSGTDYQLVQTWQQGFTQSRYVYGISAGGSAATIVIQEF